MYIRLIKSFFTACIAISIILPGLVMADSSVSSRNINQITNGMSKDQVMQILGRPDYIRTYGLDPDTTWEYARFSSRLYAIDFTPAGVVHNVRIDRTFEE